MKNVDIIIVGIFMHFLIFIINCIYEPINNVGRSIEVNILLKYNQSYKMRPFHTMVISSLPIMQCFKDEILSVFALLFYFKGPKP